MEISKLLAGLLICAGLMACSPEKPESEKTTDLKASGTNELVIANSDANALPSQEEEFSEETKAKLKKLREEAAILKAEAELNNQKVEANAAAAIASGTPTTLFTKKSRSSTTTYEKNENFIPIEFEGFTNRTKAIFYDRPELLQALLDKFVEFAGQDNVLNENETELFQEYANGFLQKAGFSAEKTKKKVDLILAVDSDNETN